MYLSDSEEDENEKNWTGNNLLHKAAELNDIITLKKLLDSNYLNGTYHDKIDDKNRFGYTPLMTAVKTRSYNSVEYLLNKKADPDLFDIKGQTCIFSAMPNIPLLELLLSHGANPEGSVLNLSTPLYNSCMLGDYNSAKLLIKYGANVDGYKVNFGLISTPLGISISKCHSNIVKLLLNYGANIKFISPPSYIIKKPYISKPIDNGSFCDANINLSTFSDCIKDPHVNFQKIVDKQGYSHLALSKYHSYIDVTIGGKIADFAQYESDKLLSLQERKVIIQILITAGIKPFKILKLANNSTFAALEADIKSTTAYKEDFYAFSYIDKAIADKEFTKHNTSDLSFNHQYDQNNLTYLHNLTKNPLPLSWICRIIIRNTLLQERLSLQESPFDDLYCRYGLPSHIVDFLRLEKIELL